MRLSLAISMSRRTNLEVSQQFYFLFVSYKSVFLYNNQETGAVVIHFSEGEAKFESCGKACGAMLTKVWWKIRLFLLGTFDGIDKITPAKLAETKVGFCQID